MFLTPSQHTFFSFKKINTGYRIHFILKLETKFILFLMINIFGQFAENPFF